MRRWEREFRDLAVVELEALGAGHRARVEAMTHLALGELLVGALEAVHVLDDRDLEVKTGHAHPADGLSELGHQGLLPFADDEEAPGEEQHGYGCNCDQ